MVGAFLHFNFDFLLGVLAMYLSQEKRSNIHGRQRSLFIIIIILDLVVQLIAKYHYPV